MPVISLFCITFVLCKYRFGYNSMDANLPKQQVIVSMTSFPAAIKYAAGAVRSILDGSVLPDKLVLYLTFSQFGDDGLPQELIELANASPVFEIRNYDRDIRSYRKLIPALQDFPDAIIVTVDDDVRYHKNMLRDLLRLHGLMPRAVLAHRAKLMKPGEPYRRWRKYRWYHFLFKRIHSGFTNIGTGVGGILYPPHCLKADMLDSVYLQQNSFDLVDANCSADRQRYVTNKLITILGSEYSLDDQDDARSFFHRMRQRFIDWNII